jgi:glycine betaine/proline transport system ATP-binding protein
MVTTVPPIECRHVWKIFGPRANEALLEAQRGQAGKSELQKSLGCVIGVADASFTVEAGEIFCIMGLSGSGKSTLLRHINGLIPATSGEVLIAGENIAALPAKRVRDLRARKMGMVFQHFGLLPHRNVIDNVGFGLELRGMNQVEREAKAREALDAVQLADWAMSPVQNLSGGMQQRVGLARALAGEPEILLMDEPFSALDPLIRRQLQDQFLALSRSLRKTTVFITHDLEEAMRIGSRIGILREGRIEQIGAPRDILLSPANEYVAAFISGISGGEALTVGDLLKEQDYKPASDTALPKVGATDKLANAARLSAERNTDLAVVDRDGSVLGKVTQAALLAALAGPGKAGHG